MPERWGICADKRITELEAELAALREQVRWHKWPEEKPPIDDAFYLVSMVRRYRFGSDSATERYVDISFPLAYRGGNWGIDSRYAHFADGGDYDVQRVVAWAYLPEPYVPDVSTEEDMSRWDALSDEALAKVDANLDAGFGESGNTTSVTIRKEE